MKRHARYRRCVWLIAGIATAAVAAPDFNDESFVRAAIVIETYDYLTAGCSTRGGQPEAAQRTVSEWESRNQVAPIRKRIAELERDPSVSASLETLREGIRNEMQSYYPQRSCEAALASIKLKEAQLATEFPDMVAQLAEKSNSSQRATPTPKPSVRSAATAGGNAAKLAPLIDSFGFDTRMTMGVGGFLTTVVYPVVLFRDGRAVKDAEALAFPGGITAHSQARPKDWTRWRRSGGRVQTQGSDGAWKNLSFGTTYSMLPADFRLDGSFSSMSGAGNVAVGGSDSVVAWRSYAFSKNGFVVRGGGAGAYAAVSGGSTAVSSIAPSQRGRYQIDGITLAINYDDGSKESRIIVADPKDPKGAIWLDGVGYTRRRN